MSCFRRMNYVEMQKQWLQRSRMFIERRANNNSAPEERNKRRKIFRSSGATEIIGASIL